MRTLVGRSLRRIAGLLGALVALLVGFQIAVIAFAASFRANDQFSGLTELVPAFVRESFGLALTSFTGMSVIGFFEPMPIMIVVQLAIYVATEPAGDVETGLVDLILARALPRHQLITRSLVTMTMVIAALPCAMALGTWAALTTLAPPEATWPGLRTVLLLAGHLAAVGWCFGTIALATGAFARRRGTGQAAIAIAAVALYLLDLLGESWDILRPVAPISPFHYFHGTEILANTANLLLDFTVLGTAGLIAVALAFWQFHRRDL